MSAEYPIETINDLLTVPPDRWDALLLDLRKWMGMCVNLVPSLSAITGLPGDAIRPRFIWIDDGDVGCRSVRFLDENGTVFATISEKKEGWP